MDGEIADASNISVTMVAIAAFLAIVMFTVWMGIGIKDDAGNSLNETVSLADEAVLSSLSVSEESIMPTASAYNACVGSSLILDGTTCYVCGQVCGCWENGSTASILDGMAGACLKGHMSGRVSVEMKYDEGTCHYYCYIHEEGCAWRSGSCTCALKDSLIMPPV